jgi:DNA primase
MHQAGFKNVIAASGTALTQEHGKIISRLSRSVTLLFDGDNAGISAVSRGADNLISTDLDIGVCVLPPEHDPDSFVKEFGYDSMKKYLDSPMTIWDFKLKTLSEKTITPQERLKIAGELAETISMIPDELKRDVYIHDICLRTGIDRDTMKKAVDGRIKRKRNNTETPDTGNGIKLTEDERGLLGSIIQYPELARHYLEEAGAKSLSNEYCRLILDAIYHRIVEGLDTTPGSLIGAVDKPEAKEYIASSAMIPIDENTAAKYIEDHLRQTKIKNIMSERKELHSKILNEKDPAKLKTFLARESELSNELRKFNS